MESVNFSLTAEGDLKIALTVQGSLHLERMLTHHSDWSDEDIFIELIDYQLTHGWASVPLSEVRAPTNSLILVDGVFYDEQGTIKATGNAYWYPDNEHKPYCMALLRKGYIIFRKGS